MMKKCKIRKDRLGWLVVTDDGRPVDGYYRYEEEALRVAHWWTREQALLLERLATCRFTDYGLDW